MMCCVCLLFVFSPSLRLQKTHSGFRCCAVNESAAGHDELFMLTYMWTIMWNKETIYVLQFSSHILGEKSKMDTAFFVARILKWIIKCASTHKMNSKRRRIVWMQNHLYHSGCRSCVTSWPPSICSSGGVDTHHVPDILEQPILTPLLTLDTHSPPSLSLSRPQASWELPISTQRPIRLLTWTDTLAMKIFCFS